MRCFLYITISPLSSQIFHKTLFGELLLIGFLCIFSFEIWISNEEVFSFLAFSTSFFLFYFCFFLLLKTPLTLYLFKFLLLGFDSFTCTRPQPSSRFIHRKTENQQWKRDDTDINVETQMWEKPRQSTNCRIHYGRGVQQRGYTEATTSCPLLRHTRRLQ